MSVQPRQETPHHRPPRPASPNGEAQRPDSTQEQSIEIARGVLLLGVFHIHALHALIDHLGDTSNARLAWLQIKLLSGHVVLFFALSGLTSAALAERAPRVVLQRSLMLMLVAAGSHAIGVLILHALWQPWHSTFHLLSELVRPVVFGTGHANFVAWFFVVLAVVRLLAYVLSRHGRSFLLLTAIGVAVITGSIQVGLPPNLYEWRNWPAALLMFVLGMHIAPGWRVPHAIGLPAAIAGLALPLFNRPDLWSAGFCVGCEPQFVAQPTVGGYGFMPLYFAQEFAAVFGLLWLARLLSMTALAKTLAWIGRRSLQLLVLHGWVILSAYGLAGAIPLQSAGAWLFVAVLVANTMLHVLLYKLLSKPLGAFFMACSAASGRLTAMARVTARAARRTKASTSRH